MKDRFGFTTCSRQFIWRQSEIRLSNIAFYEAKVLSRRTGLANDLLNCFARGWDKCRLCQENKSRALTRQPLHKARRQKAGKASNKDCFVDNHVSNSHLAYLSEVSVPSPDFFRAVSTAFELETVETV